MLSRKHWDQLTGAEIIEQVKLRYELLQQLVGTLYPGIVMDEEVDLRILFRKVTGTSCPV